MSITPENTVNGIALPILSNQKYLVMGGASYPFRGSSDIDILTIREAIDTSNYSWRNISDKGATTKIGHNVIDVTFANQEKVLETFLDIYGGASPSFQVDAQLLLKAGHIHIARKGKSWDTDIRDFHTLLNMLWPSNHNVFTHSMCHKLQKYNDIIHGNHTMNLDQTKEEFFDDGVKKYIEHDRLHEIFAHQEQPMYKRTQKENQTTVFCHWELWDQLSWEEQIKMVMEETYVIAAERFLIPAHVEGRTYLYNKALHQALQKVCTTLSSGWFRHFSILNYYNIKNMLDLERFKYILNNNVLKERI